MRRKLLDEQRVRPFTDLRSFRADFWRPEDPPDEFLAALAQRRRDAGE